MKIKSSVSLAIVCASALLTGCKLIPIAVPVSRVQVKPAEVVTNTVIQTNYVSETVFKTNVVTINVTNEVTHEVAQVQQKQIQEQVFLTPVFTTNEVVRTNAAVYADQVDTSRVENGVKVVGTVASGVGVPFAGAGAAAIALIVGMIGRFYNRRQIAKLTNEHDGKMEVAQDALKTVVQNIEQIRGVVKQLPNGDALDAKAMEYVIKAQRAVGPEVKALIESHVSENTIFKVPTLDVEAPTS